MSLEQRTHRTVMFQSLLLLGTSFATVEDAAYRTMSATALRGTGPLHSLLCGCQVIDTRVLFSSISLMSRPKRDLLLCVARHPAVTLTKNAPLSKAQSPGISVCGSNRREKINSPRILRTSSSRSLGRCLLLGQRSRMNLLSHHVRSLLHQNHRNPRAQLTRHRHNGPPRAHTPRGWRRQTERKNSRSSPSWRIADEEAWMSLLLSRPSPLWVIAPRWVFSPVERSLGTSPKNPASWRTF